jgi:hypothetical protein
LWHENPNDCEQIFKQDSRDKKRTAQGARHNSGRRGGGTQGIKGSLNFPYQWLKNTDKKAYKEYVKGSAIVEYNMYTDINNCPSLEKLRDIDSETAHNILVEVRKHNTINIIRDQLKISGYMLYKVFDEFNIEYEKRGSKEEIAERAKVAKEKRKYKRKEKQEDLIEIVSIDNEPDEITYIPEVIEKPVIPEIIEEDEEFQLKYNKKIVGGAELQKRILDFMAIVYEDKKYKIELTIKELPEVE